MSVNDLQEIGDRLLVIFDGRCGFCNGAVRWFLRRDRRDRLRFVASDSPAMAGLLARHRIDGAATPDGPGSLLIARAVGTAHEEILNRSTAALAMLAELRGGWPAIAAVLGIIPLPLRDAVYELVARNRYRLRGRLKACPTPTAAEREHFL